MQQEACHCPQRKKINLRRVLRPVAGFNVRLQRSQRRVSRLGWQPSSSPVAVCTHLLIRSRQPPCRNVWSKQEKVSFSAIGEPSFDRQSLLQFRFKEKQRSPVRGTGKGVAHYRNGATKQDSMRQIIAKRLMKASQCFPQRGYCGVAVCAVLRAVAVRSWAESNPRPQGNDGWRQNQPANRLPQNTSRVPKKPRARGEEFWCSIIDSATAQATGLEPAMRSYVLDAVASAFKKCAPGKVRKVLVDAFTATLGIPESEEQV